MGIDSSMYNFIKSRYLNDNREVINFYGSAIYSEKFYNDIDKIAGFLVDMGVKKGESVALCLPNIPSAIVVFYAINKIGAVANIIHPLVPPLGLKKIMDTIGSKIIFLFDLFCYKYNDIFLKSDVKRVICSAGDYLPFYMKYPYALITIDKKLKIAKSINNINFSKLLNLKGADVTVTDSVAEGNDTAVYLHSGGTTGAPKTVMLSNSALNQCAENIVALKGAEVKPGESMLMVLPLFHVFGLGVCMHSTISEGGRVIMIPQFKPKSTAKVIAKQKVNYITGVPAMFEKLLNQKAFYGEHLKSLRACYCGGDKLKLDIKKRFDSAMRANQSDCVLSEGYGLTEATICAVSPKLNDKTGAVGKAIGNIKIAIFDEKLNKLGADKKGEICIGGNTVMQGYYNDNETSNQVLFESDGQLWVRTGDCGYLDKDDFLFYVDRYKRMIKISGINVFPQEIESVLYSNLNYIRQCCAVETKINGKSAIKLYVVLDNKKIDAVKEEILKTIKDNLMHYSMPKIIEEKDSLPMTQIGKVDYSKLEEK